MSPEEKPEIILSVSCVYYDTDLAVFKKTITTLLESVNYAKLQGILNSVELHLINNNSQKDNDFLALAEEFRHLFDRLIVHNKHGNIGYGRGNNLAIKQVTSIYHLILNPDVYQQQDALYQGIQYLDQNLSVGMVAPSAVNQYGEIEYLAKRQPTLLVLFLRALNKPFFNKIFNKQLVLYAYQDKISDENEFEIEIASGCYMLCRTNLLKKLEGFSEKYFLYFEDFDLSRKIKTQAKIMYLQSVKILHYGGGASKKGLSHILMFFFSYLKYKN